MPVSWVCYGQEVTQVAGGPEATLKVPLLFLRAVWVNYQVFLL